jgi:hypothetical protein
VTVTWDTLTVSTDTLTVTRETLTVSADTVTVTWETVTSTADHPPAPVRRLPRLAHPWLGPSPVVHLTV